MPELKLVHTEEAWSPTIRALHWVLAILTTGVLVAAVVDARGAHGLLGLALLPPLLARVGIGLTGRPHERFSSFLHRPSAMLAQLQTMVGGSARRQLGHNPLAGPVMLLVLVALLVNVVTGAFLQVAEADEGPLAHLRSALPAQVIDPAAVLHSVMGVLVVGLVLLHLAGLAAHSIRHREPIVVAMITGEKLVDDDSSTLASPRQETR